MNQPIDLVTHGQLRLTPKAAILASVIRKAVADQRSLTERSAVDCHVAGRP